MGDTWHERHPAEVGEEDGGEPDVVLHPLVDPETPEILKTGKKIPTISYSSKIFLKTYSKDQKQ